MTILLLFIFFFNDTATTEIYTLSLPTLFRSARWPGGRTAGALRTPRRRARPLPRRREPARASAGRWRCGAGGRSGRTGDRKSTRLNSSHANISYAVFCLKKKKNNKEGVYSVK